MSHFVASACRLDAQCDVTQVAWSYMDPIAALATVVINEKNRTTHKVLFMNSEGGMIANSSVSHSAKVTSLDWQPNGRVLAIGWADGMVSCWVVDGKIRPSSTFSNSSQHSAPITIVKWNPFGKRLVTGDKTGLLCVWAVDARGTLSPSRQYRKKGAITAAVFCKLPTPQRYGAGAISITGGRVGESAAVVVAKVNQVPPFFFCTDRGGLSYADDLGHCTDVQQLSSAVDVMLFFEERAKLVVITRTLLLTQYQVGDDGRVSRSNQVKLSVAGDIAETGLRSVCWAGPGVLAIATHERMLRLLDLAVDESYNLSIVAACGDLIARNDYVVSVAYNPLDRYLVVGTQGGAVIVWRYIGPARDTSVTKGVIPSTAAADWEVHYKTTVQSPLRQLSWYRGQGIVAAVTDEGVTTFTESVITNGYCDELAVCQVSSHEVTVHVGDQKPFKEHGGMLIRGLSVARTAFAVWSGKAAGVMRVDGSFRRAEAVDSFACISKCIAIADTTCIVEEALFIVSDDNSVRICNYSGVQKGTITFSEAEGTPELCDVNDKYLVIITSKGLIKVLDVHNPTKPKALGSLLKFTHDAGTVLSVRSIRINCNGTRIAILADHVEGSLAVRHPDSRLHVLDRNKGGMFTYDFNRNAASAGGSDGVPTSGAAGTPTGASGSNSLNGSRYPVAVCWDNMDDRLLAVETHKSRGGMGALKAVVQQSGAAGQDEEGGAAAPSAAPSSPFKSSRGLGGKNGTAQASTSANASGDGSPASTADVEILTFFATTENGLLVQDQFARKVPFGALIGINVPKLYFRNAPPAAQDEDNGAPPSPSKSGPQVLTKTMRDFVGLANVDYSTKMALLDFSYNLTLGKLDEAYRAVKSVNSTTIWENMAHMCVKTQRLDVAEVCLSNMGHARGAAALRESRKAGNSTLASVGVLAIQLGLLDDAAKCFRDGDRHDLLNRLYQAAGLWDKALAVAGEHDRIHLKSTHYQFAKYLECVGDVQGAITHFEASDTYRTEVPRMMYALGRVEDLEEYIQRSDDAALLKWWGAYLESNERFDKARKYYTKADDCLSLVRIFCFKGEFSRAAEIVQDSNNRAAAYHVARQLENQGELREAISYYATSGCYNHAIRLAKAYGLDAELMRFATKSTPSLMLDCASYFEAKGELDKAVQLYHKGGDLAHALDVCFRAGELLGNTGNTHGAPRGGEKKDPAKVAIAKSAFELLNTIAQDLGAATSPQTLARCADFLVQHKQYEKAVELYIMAKKYNHAIEMCAANRVDITESMCEKLTPPIDDTMDSNERKDILKELAKALKKQGAFALASKKFTQAGDRIRAMKCLVRSGNTDSVINFAKICKNAEIYTLAANYLQQMNWRGSIDIMKAIVTFYTQAKAFEQLASFFESCAQVEIDEYRDYEKATGALREALKHLNKATTVGGGGGKRVLDLIDILEKRIALIDKFVQARKAAARDPERMISICEDLLQNEPNLEEAVRVGDCLAMLVEHFHGKGQHQQANSYLEEMRRRSIQAQPFVDADVLEDLNRRYNSRKPAGGGGVRGGQTHHGSGNMDDHNGGGGGGRGGGSANDDEEVGEDDIPDEVEDEEEEVPEIEEEDEEEEQSRGYASRRNAGGRAQHARK